MKRHNLAYFLACAVALITFIVYLAALRNDFVEWDDSQYVIENLRIRSFNLNFLKWAFFDFYAANWHPLTWLSHALDYAVWGLNPPGHHLTSNILHAVNTFLVVLLMARLMEIAADGSRFTLVAAATTGLLFGLHPLHVESVAWVAERKDLLCAFFFLLSILMYVKYRSHTTYRAYIVTLSFFTLALLSKPMAVTLPAVLLLLDWYPFNRITSFETFRNSFIEKLPFIALSIGSSVLTVLAQKAGGTLTTMEIIPLSTRMLVGANAVIVYLGKMILPVNLIPYYPYPQDVSFFSAGYFPIIVLSVMITAVCIVMAKKQKKLFLSVWTYYILTLLPVLGLVQVGGQSMADRYTYLPSLGPFFVMGILAAWGAEKTQGRNHFLRYAGAAAILLLLAVSFLTWKQIKIWENSFTLWTYVIEKEPVKVPLAYNNRGLAFYRKGQADLAVEDFNKAIVLDPVFFKAYLNRGATFVHKGLFDQAATDFDKAIALNPSYSEAHNAKGSLFGMSGSLGKAIEQFSKAIQTKPNYSAAYGNRGAAYSIIGQNSRALEDLDRAINLDGYYAENYLHRGNVHLATSNRELAVSDFRRACALGNNSGCETLQALGGMTPNQEKQKSR